MIHRSFQQKQAVARLVADIKKAAARFDDDVPEAGHDLANLAGELRLQTMNPIDAVFHLVHVPTMLHAVFQTIFELDILERIPERGEMSFQTLAEVTECNLDGLRRVLRFACHQKIFQETKDGIRHSPISKAIQRRKPWVVLGLAKLIKEAAKHLRESLQSGTLVGCITPALELAYGSNLWDVLSTGNAGMCPKEFQAGMKAYPAGELPYPWQQLGRATVIDVGGGEGHVAVNLARLFPRLQFVVQDLELNIDGAARTISAEVSDRVRFEVHDFWTVQPAPMPGTVVYFMRWILHDWHDDDCVMILRQLLPGLKNTQNRLLIAEAVLPSRLSEQVNHREIEDLTLDLNMFTLFGAHERTEEQFQALLHRADPRLRIQKCWGSSIDKMKVLEVRLLES